MKDQVPTLSTAAQYPNWAAKMKGFLIMIGAWTVVKAAPNPSVLAAHTTEQKAKHEELIAKAQGAIMMRVDRTMHRLLEKPDGDPKEPHEVWDTLKSQCGTPDAAATWAKFETIIGMDRLSDKKPLQDQLGKLQNLLKEVSDGNLKLADNMQALLVLSKIPESYRTLVTGLLLSKDLKDLKIDDIVDKVLAEENVRKTGAGGSNGSSSASRVSQTKSKKSGPCGHCGKSGHDESSC